MRRVGIIGNGNLSYALSSLFLRNGLTNFNISDVDKTRSQDITNSENIEDSDILFLCVKPKDMGDVLPLFTNFENKTIVSCAAGIKLAELEKYSDSCIRIMSNLSIQYGKGTISYFSKTSIPEQIKTLCRGPKLLKCEEERMLDIFTVTNGSTPAFISYFAKEYVHFAVSRGLTMSEAMSAYISTLEGTAELLKHFSPDDIISKVSSPNGVTAKAITHLNNSEVRENIRESLEVSLNHLTKLKH